MVGRFCTSSNHTEPLTLTLNLVTNVKPLTVRRLLLLEKFEYSKLLTSSVFKGIFLHKLEQKNTDNNSGSRGLERDMLERVMVRSHQENKAPVHWQASTTAGVINVYHRKKKCDFKDADKRKIYRTLSCHPW